MLEKMPKCNCNRNFDALFVCLKSDQECKDSKTQKFYCVKCSEEKHDHRSVVISSELTKQNTRWQSLKNDVGTTFTKADIVFKELRPLIAYLEEAMMQPNIAIQKPVKWLNAEFNSLKTLNQNINNVYDTKIK